MKIDFQNEPPTDKQVDFAEKIARELDVELPEERTKQAYSEFIDTWKNDLDWNCVEGRFWDLED